MSILATHATCVDKHRCLMKIFQSFMNSKNFAPQKYSKNIAYTYLYMA